MPRAGVVASVLLVVALVTAPAAAGLTVTSPAGTPERQLLTNRTNTSDILRLPSTNESGLGTATLNLSMALSAQWQSGRDTIDREALARRVRTVEDSAVKTRLLMETLRSVNARISTLLARERQARLAYADGPLQKDQYLTRLGAIYAEAAELETTLETIQDLLNEEVTDDPQSVTDTLLRARARLALITGPLRAELMKAVQGTGPSPLVYVGVSPAGVTLAAVRGDQFVHATARFDHFAEPPATDPAGVSAAIDRWATLYPTVWDPSRVSFRGLGGTYRASLPFSGGRLISYLDATTLEIYRETQFKDLADVPMQFAVATTQDNLRLVVERSYPGGPLHIRFTTSDGDPLDGLVRVNGLAVGETGADGLLWTLTPGGQFTVSVDYGDRQLTVVVEPTSEF
ncbi:MAG: hypothetical protein ABEJ35_03310 [Halobacteriaceae archaeon]